MAWMKSRCSRRSARGGRGREEARARRCWAVVSVLALAGCTEPIARTPIVVVISVDADTVVRDESVRVEVEVDTEVEEGSGWRNLDRRLFRADPRPIRWPISFKLPPARMIGESYGLLATAYDSRGAIVARGQAIRSGSRAVGGGLHAYFETACYRQTMLCSEGTTCHGGACVSARDELQPSAADSGPLEPVVGAPARAPVDPSDGLAMEGESCDTEGAGACTGHGTRNPLRCGSGTWQALPECEEDERCDSAAGNDRGACKPVARECMNQQVNVPFCDAEMMRVCTDLVSSLVRPCDEHQRCAPGSMGAECTCEPGYVFTEDGAHCIVATACGDDNGGCDPVTECSMASGVRTCSACPPGYTGTGEKGCAPLLQGLALDVGDLEPPFDPAVRAYRVRVPIVAPRAVLTARAPDHARVTFDAIEVANGQPWTSSVLQVGERSVELRLTTSFGEWTSYAITIERTGSQPAFIKSSNSEFDDWFGYSLALSGDTFVAGAFSEDSSATGVNGSQGNGAEESGAAYVFVRNGETWTQQAYLKSTDHQAGDFFGASAGIDGDTIAVGATRTSVLSPPTASSRSGVAYVFTREGGVWSQRQRLAPSNPRNGDWFGISLDLAGDTLAIGAAYGGGADGALGGAVHVFQREGSSWPEREILTPSKSSTQFGTSVVLDGDRMIVGAPGEDGETGATYVFVKRDGRWIEEQRLRPDSLEAGSKFGYSVTILGDHAAVGAPHHPRTGSSASVPPGAVYVFDRADGRWQQSALLHAPIPDQTDYFGASVALSKWGLAIGSNGEASGAQGVNGDASNNDAPWAGAAYLFANTGSSWESSVYLKAHNTGGDSGFGYAVALGPEMFVVAAPNESSLGTGVNGEAAISIGAYRSGAVYVFH